MKSIFKLITILSGLLFYAGQSEASCSFISLSSHYVNFGNITVQRDMPVGQTIATSTVAGTGQKIGSCAGGGYSYDQFTYLSKTTTGISNVFATNIPGVGIKLGTTDGTYFWPYPTPSVGYYYSGNLGIYEYSGATVSLIKTGNITSGTLQSGLIGRSYFDDGRDYFEISLNGGSVTQVACSITTPNVNVPLVPALASSFTGINSTKGDYPFTIGLSCDAGARINASLSFNQNPDTTNTSVIKLSNAGAAGIATGVGIQLLYGSTPLQNNNNIVLKTSSGGQEFPAGAFTARYFQTKSTVTTGNANATATLNLTYQ